MGRVIKIALVGQPNVGKSLLINALCGANMKVGNFAGVTVEKSQAQMTYKGYILKIIDLPGTYTLNGYSQEEKVTRNFIQARDKDYDLIVNVADSTNLERNLLLSTQLMETQARMILALNMIDEAKQEGIEVQHKILEDLFGIPCLPISADTGENLQELLDCIIKTFEEPYTPNKRYFSNPVEEEIAELVEFLEAKKDGYVKELGFSCRELAIRLLKQDEIIYQFLHNKPIWIELSKSVQNCLSRLYVCYETQSVNDIFMEELSAFVSGAIAQSVRYGQARKESYTQKVDNILIHRFFGIPIFLFLMWMLFQITFTLGSIPMDYIEMVFNSLSGAIKDNLPNKHAASLLADGILGGVGAVVLFLPNIIILFFGIALLETTGYMTRVAFLLDGFFHKFGLHGQSFIPLVTGFGCSVPAFMATRTLKNQKDRLLTLFIINFMSCGARLPVYVLFIGAFFPREQAGNWLFGIYILGAILGLIAAKILRLTAFRGSDEPFVMEMPKYRMPNWRLVWFMIFNKAKMYLKKAGTFILVASVLIWFASTYPMQEDTKAAYEQQIQATQDESEQKELNFKLEKTLIENSYLGQAGKFVEPLFGPLDFDWRLSVSLVSGLAAKEVAISTLGVLYSLGKEVDEGDENLMEILKAEIPFKVAVSYILFVMIYNPCFAATIVFGREAGGFRYIVYLFLFSCTTAYIGALIAGWIVRML